MLVTLASILARFGITAPEPTPVTTGLIHKTYRVDADDGRRFALQSVSPIFVREVHDDIDACTAHLARKGMTTPRIVPTLDDQLSLAKDGEIWRVLTWLEGDTKERVGSPADARTAATLLGRFHGALLDLSHTFRAKRLGVHDTAKHLATLGTALETHGEHRLFAEVEPLGREILVRAQPLLDLSALPDRVVHGDPKITNVLFDHESGRATAFVDLDTIAPMKLPHELGDALRSWSNPAGEDAQAVVFDAQVFQAALEGYSAGAPPEITAAETELFMPATRLIILELAARFAADALNESYFGWNQAKFGSRGEHNLLRARAQLLLARDFDRQTDGLEKIARTALAR